MSDIQDPRLGLKQKTFIWLLFFLICLGLGYPPLSRYDPARLEGTSDVGVYRDLVVGRGPARASDGTTFGARLTQSENRYRVLVPYAAKPFYWLARGHLRTWDAALFALLVANAIFTATTALLLVAIGHRLRLDHSTALLGAALYLLNFCVANLNLVGLIDSAEGCFVLVVAWSLLTDRWFLLPLWGVCGALAKETFAPLSFMFVLGWWMSGVRRDRFHLLRLAWAAALGLASITTVTTVMSFVVGGFAWPWQFAGEMREGSDLLAGLRGCVLDHTFWYIFIWLLPLGLLGFRRLPRPWVVATAAAFCGALVLGAYNDARGNTSRALFNVAGPILSLSAAVFLTRPREAIAAGPSAAADAVPMARSAQGPRRGNDCD